MPIEKVRASLSGDALRNFDNAMSNIHYCSNVKNSIIDFHDAKNFIFKAEWNTKPYNGFVTIKDGLITGSCCC